MTSSFALAMAFIRISLGAFGGGLTTLPLIHHELVLKGLWISEETFAELISVAQITPGPVALNSATFVGYRMGGFAGALLTSLCVLFPPLMLIAAGMFFASCGKRPLGVRLRKSVAILAPGVAAMLVMAFLKLAGSLNGRPGLIVISGVSLLCLRLPLFRNRPPLLFLLGGMAAVLLQATGLMDILSR